MSEHAFWELFISNKLIAKKYMTVKFYNRQYLFLLKSKVIEIYLFIF